MGTKMAVVFANIFMAKVETKILNQSGLTGRSSGNDSLTTSSSLWNTKHYQTIKFTNFLDTTVYKDERFKTEAVLEARTHFKPTETFHYSYFSTCRPSEKRGFIKGEALRLLRTNSSKKLFEESVTNFKTHLLERGYPENFN